MNDASGANDILWHFSLWQSFSRVENFTKERGFLPGSVDLFACWNLCPGPNF